MEAQSLAFPFFKKKGNKQTNQVVPLNSSRRPPNDDVLVVQGSSDMHYYCDCKNEAHRRDVSGADKAPLLKTPCGAVQC